ncbi:MAG: alkaline phosphatase family protein, partial [Peptococcaceae bacterium]|nr:alkaline phosphatase family protein [Peptococcaceae bacterium]
MPTASASKILLLGIDGLDPKLTRKYLDQGKMPNTQKLLDRGAARQDLKMLGGVPTVTPPMWTTMATGCYANVHGIVEFNRTIPELGYEYMGYNLDSRYCKAEPLWNVLAEAGK